jgi:hypothetical protein
MGSTTFGVAGSAAGRAATLGHDKFNRGAVDREGMDGRI